MKPFDSLTNEEFVELVQQAASLPDAPPMVLEAAEGLWTAKARSLLTSTAASAGQVIKAVLSFDSWAHPAVAYGMRSVGADKRHLLFNAGERDVDLRISGGSDLFALTGQILGPDEAGSIELVPDSGASGPAASPHQDGRSDSSRVATLDELGEFRLKDIQAGAYRLTLRLGNDEIVLPQIVIGEQPG